PGVADGAVGAGDGTGGAPSALYERGGEHHETTEQEGEPEFFHGRAPFRLHRSTARARVQVVAAGPRTCLLGWTAAVISRSRWLAAVVALAGAFALWKAGAAAATAWRRRSEVARERAMDAAATRLRDFDEARPSGTDFSRAAAGDRRSGADPYLVAEIPGSDLLVGILRGADAVVLLDGGLREVQRLRTPRAPAALAVAGDEVFVAGELEPAIARFRLRAGARPPPGAPELAHARALRRPVAGGGGWPHPRRGGSRRVDAPRG